MRLVLILAGAAALCSAQQLDVKLGLWETTSTTEMTGMPVMPQIDTSKMTPDQRARVEAAMKGRGMGPQSATAKSCVTKDTMDKLYQTANPRNSSCKNTVVSGNGRAIEVKMVCTGEHPASGDLHLEAESRESIKGLFKMVMTQAGRTINMNMTMTSKWLGDACGDVK